MHFGRGQSPPDLTLYDDCAFLLRAWKGVDDLPFPGKAEDAGPKGLVTKNRTKENVAVRIEEDRLSLDGALAPGGNDELVVDVEEHASSVRRPASLREFPLVLPVPKVDDKISIAFQALLF